MKQMQLLTLTFALLIVAVPAIANNLSQLQESITQQQAKIEKQQKKRATLQSTLQEQELKISQVNTELKKTEMELNDIRKMVQHTEQEIKRLEKLEKVQKEKLKEQLDSAYRSGIHPSMWERLLSEPARDADRIEHYYFHLNQMRIEAIQNLQATQQKLKHHRDELKHQQGEQQVQLSQQKKQERELTKIKNERESTLRSIDKTLAADQNRLQTLKANEIALRQQIEQAAKAAAEKEQREIAELEQQKKNQGKSRATEQEKDQLRAGAGLVGKHQMPVRGKVIHRFGSPLMGELKWNAVVIEAPAGTAVKSIASGKVVLVSWLNGYGNMVAINHGKDDISFYGYNESISVQVGDRVEAGQTIATVGNTGGQKRAALYFAIRRKGVAVNPLKWVK